MTVDVAGISSSRNQLRSAFANLSVARINWFVIATSYIERLRPLCRGSRVDSAMAMSVNVRRIKVEGLSLTTRKDKEKSQHATLKHSLHQTIYIQSSDSFVSLTFGCAPRLTGLRL